jgi:hypothetical protein
MTAANQEKLRVDVGPERIVLTDGLQPFIFQSAKGTLFVQAQMNPPPGYKPPPKNAIPGGLPGSAISRDNGQSWRRWWPEHVEDALPMYYEGAAATLTDGTILLIEWIADGPTETGDFLGQIWESQDDFETLQGPTPATIRLPQAKGGFDDGGHPYSGVTFHRTLLQLPGGDLLATIYCWFRGDDTPSSYLPKMNKFRCVLLRSADRGRNWRYVSTVAADPAVGQEGFDEPTMVRLSKGPRAGRLVCLMRTGSTSCPIYQVVSDDEGATWSVPRALGFCGVDPDLVEMADGTLACSCGWRTADWASGKPSPEHGNYLVFSLDQGETWSHSTRWPIEPHSGINYSTCYTSVREIQPGILLVLYDVGAWGRAVRYIAGRKIRVQRG